MEVDGSFAGLLEAARRGDPAACTYIWRTYGPAVAGYLRSHGSREPDDLTSEVFLTVFKTLPQFTGEEPDFRTYVFVVAHRRLVDELRRRGRRGDPEPWEEHLDHRRAPSAEEELLRSASTDRVRALLDGLSSDQREVLLLRILGDLTVDQVAAVVEKRPGAVKALQRRGLQALRKKLSPGRTPPDPSSDDGK